MSSPWAKIKKPDSVDLTEIMSEEVARDLQAKEDKKSNYTLDLGKQDEARVSSPNPTEFDPQVLDEIPDEVLQAISNDTVDSDTVIAQMLQMQYDKEYDDLLKKTEQKFNGASKVSISFENYRRVPQNFDFESESEEEEIEDIRDRKDWDRFDELKRDLNSIPVCGYKVQKNGDMITKHDLVNSARKNACKLLSFPPGFQTGDGETFDLKLSNKVFNSQGLMSGGQHGFLTGKSINTAVYDFLSEIVSCFDDNLKTYANKEQARRHKVHDRKEDHATAEFGMDESSRMLLYKMINASLLKQVNGVISIGKEAVILHAETDPDFPDAKEPLPKECAIKVFKTTLSEFKQRDKYIKDDYRFKDRIGKQNSKKVVHIWAEKEMANLMRLKRAGLNCPEVVTLKKHVLVMSFIGKDHRPAPKLKDVHDMTDVDVISAYNQIVEGMKILYHKANLIHADLSEYNVLWHEGRCYFIDVSQSVEPSHENAFHFLYRDCCNVINFFSKKTVPNIATPDELFEEIVGHAFTDRIALTSVQESFKMKPHMVDKPGVESSFTFESAWEKSRRGEVPQQDGASGEEGPKIEQERAVVDALPA